MEVGKTINLDFLFFKSHYLIEIQITFESATWSTKVDTIEIEDRMISFPIPRFPYPINTPIPVNVILRQGERFLQTRKYSYIPQCN